MRSLLLLALVIAGCSGSATAIPEPDATGWVELDAEHVGAALRAHPSPYLLVNVWSTWCEPCLEEMPMLVRVAREHEARGLALVTISADPRSERDAARAILARHGAPLPGWIRTGSDDAFVQALHPDWSGVLPATLLLDRERRASRFFAEQVDEAELRAAITELLGGGQT